MRRLRLIHQRIRSLFSRRSVEDEGVRALPSVRSVSLSVLTPLSGRDTGKFVSAPGFQPRHDLDRTIHVNHVSGDYLRTFGVRLLAGRAFTSSDTGQAPKVAILNEAAAAAYFAGRDPIGSTLDFDKAGTYRVVGVARNYKHMSVREPAPRFVFVPLTQPLAPVGRITLAVATDQPLPAMARTIGDQVLAVHANTLISDVNGVDEHVAATLVTERLLATLATAFAALALGLAAVGLYGMLSYAVAQRRAEFGVRMALGATSSRVATGLVAELLPLVAVGLATGLPLSYFVAHAAGSLLFGVTPFESAPYLVSAVVVGVVAGAAAWLPARRAGAIDPAEALRGPA